MVKHITRWIRLVPNLRKEPYLLFKHILGFYPGRIEYYEMAVVHKSVVHPSPDNQSDNERLEFLGDAVLNSVVADILYHRFSEQQEGFLTNTRSKLVKRETLNQLARLIGLDKIVKTSKYVDSHTNNNIYGNALEALIGAIYLDFGYNYCKKFIQNKLINSLIDMNRIVVQEENFKSRIIEICQKYRLSFDFILIDETLSEDNRHKFNSKLIIEGSTISEASGSSKKESHQNAAQIAYKMFETHPDLLTKIIASKTASQSTSPTQ